MQWEVTAVRMLRCPKCGAAVVSHDAFLRDVLDRIEQEEKILRHAKGADANAAQQRRATLTKIYQQLMHMLVERERLEAEVPVQYTELRNYVLRNGLMTKDELEGVMVSAKYRAKLRLQEKDKVIERLYGDFETICNHTMPDPTARAAVRRADNGRKEECD